MNPKAIFIPVVACVSLFLLGGAQSTRAEEDAPTREIVEKVLKSSWDKDASPTNPKSTLTLGELKMGKAYKATIKEVEVEGIPEGGMVTPAVVDFTVRNFYSNATQVVRRVREARIYKDKLGEWAVMTGSVKGQDITTQEPAVR